MLEELDKLFDEVETKVETFFSNLEPTPCETIGLDKRSGTVYCFGDSEHGYIACRNDHNNRALAYYGGFEYVDAEHVKVLGDWVFYSSASSRVEGHLMNLDEEVD